MALVLSLGNDQRPEPDTVELFGHTFAIRRVTRSVQKNLEQVDKALAAMPDDSGGDDVVAAMSDGLDALLEPQDGKGKHAKTVLQDAWKRDLLGLDQLNDLYAAVQESAAKRPPTSAPAS